MFLRHHQTAGRHSLGRGTFVELRIAILAAVLSMIFWAGACTSVRKFHLWDTSIPATMKQLVEEQPAYFANPLTLVILIDTSPCARSLAESRWWKGWKRRLEQAGCGFVFATSRSDSLDVAVAAELDSATSPVLIFPPDKAYASESRARSGVLPLKLLVDRSGRVRMSCSYLADTTGSNWLMAYVDSLVRLKKD